MISFLKWLITGPRVKDFELDEVVEIDAKVTSIGLLNATAQIDGPEPGEYGSYDTIQLDNQRREYRLGQIIPLRFRISVIGCGLKLVSDNEHILVKDQLYRHPRFVRRLK